MLNQSKVKIHVENDNLIMYGSSTESPGCVLRGVMSLELQEPTKIKSILLELVGKMSLTYREAVTPGNERLFKQEKLVFNHLWPFLPRDNKLHYLNQGKHTFDFELALPGDLPESSYVSHIYTVHYELKATIERSTFIPNICHQKEIRLCRQLLPLTPEFLEPIAISSQWADKLEYEISLPSKIFTHGDEIPISIRITPMNPYLKVRHLTCTLKEYTVCRASPKPRTHEKILFSHKDDKFGKTSPQNLHFIEWTKTQVIPLPSSLQDLQCDIRNDVVRIGHKIKFVVSLINADGHVSELRAALPISICAVNNTGLPAYEEAWRSIPYDPTSTVYRNVYHLPSYTDTQSVRSLDSFCSVSVHPPNYEEVPHLVCP